MKLYFSGKLFSFICTSLVFIQATQAHFVWLDSVEETGQTKGVLYFSESAHLQDYRLPEKITKASVWQKSKDKKDLQLEMSSVETDNRIGLETIIDSSSNTILAATCDYGIYGGSLLSYYTKHIRCSNVEELGSAGQIKELQLEIVPRVLEGKIELTVLWKGKPKADVEVEIGEPDDESHSLTTDAQGRARYRPTATGLVGVRAGFTEKEAKGELDGEEYTGAAHYATLTFRIDSLESFPEQDDKSSDSQSASAIPVSDFSELPEGLASFGGAVHDGWLYVYGGHIGGAHDHSRENLSQQFRRLKLSGGTQWEQLPMQTPLQGLALVSHESGLYRVGGMNARNAPKEDEDLHSTADFARYDPATREWTKLPKLPSARSSHDAVVIGDKLYVAGGWTLEGDGEGTWLNTALVFDLTNQKGGWSVLPKAPFTRRALAVSHWQGQLVLLGGIDSEGDISFEVDLYNPETQQWGKGPKLPWQGMEAFGISAWNLGGQLYVSGLAESVFQLGGDGHNWTEATALKIPRFFHQLLPLDNESLLAVAGASRRGHLTHIEKLPMPDRTAATSKAELSSNKQASHIVPVSNTVPKKESSQVESANLKSNDDSAGNWPGFRGFGNSVSSARDLPTRWNDEEGIFWEANLPGYGQSSPIVWQDKLFVTTMQGENKETPTVLCFDLFNGKEKWRREFQSSQEIEASNYVTRSSPTPVCDAQAIYAFFEGGELVALDHEGKTLWQRSLVKEYGEFQGDHGIGSSLAATEDAVIILVNHDGPSYLMAVNKKDGTNLWKVDYEKRVAWSSPIVTRYDGRSIAIVSAGGLVEAYDADSGNLLWQIEDLPGNNVPSATTSGDLVFIGAKDVDSNVALHLNNLSTDRVPEILWRSEKQSCSFCSPLYHRDLVYSVNRSGVAFCVHAQSGEITWKQRLGDSCWASPLAAGDNIYFFTKSGTTKVISHGNTYEELAENILTIGPETRIYGTAAVNGKLILRTGSRLICVGS